MASHNVFHSLVLTSASKIKIVPSRMLSPARCHHSLRSFTSGNALQTSLKRKLQTSSGWKPHVFSPQPPPTLVAGKPNTTTPEIAARFNDNRLSVQTDQYDDAFKMPRLEISSTGSTDQIMHPPTSVINTSTTTESKQRPKLRARKAAIKLTPSAVNRLRNLTDQPSPKLIKIGVRNRGCSGLAYHLEFVDKAGLLDEEVIQDGVKIIIDSKALFSIIGSEMDWVEDKLNQKFVFKNPNIKEQCGCGESFMV